MVLDGHPVLNQPCEPWNGQEDPTELVKAMMRIMIATNGIGLAAPQVGRSYRMFVMGNSDKMYACFNPRIVAASEEHVMDKEGCLSFPGLWLNIKRPAWVEAEYEDV